MLLADDDPRNCQALAKALSTKGINVLTAENGKIALELLSSEPLIDVILMDLMMPGVGGFEAAKMLRADPRTSHIPILALTAYGEEKMQARAKAAGMDGFVLKTILPADLSDVLSEYLPPA